MSELERSSDQFLPFGFYDSLSERVPHEIMRAGGSFCIVKLCEVQTRELYQKGLLGHLFTVSEYTATGFVLSDDFGRRLVLEAVLYRPYTYRITQWPNDKE